MAGKSANSRIEDTSRGSGFLGANNVTGKRKEYHTFQNANALLAQPLQATGGDVSNGLQPGNGYTYHAFSSPGTFQVTSGQGEIEVLIVAGGGGGGASIAGGGGAGGVLTGTISVPSSTTYVVEVGRGGWKGPRSAGGEPSNFYISGTTFPNPSQYARAYGGGTGNTYATEYQTPINPGTTIAAPTPGSIGGGCDGGSGGGAGNQYGTGGFPGFTSRASVVTAPAPLDYVGSGYAISPITPAPYRPAHPAPDAVLGTAYGSDAPVPGSPGIHPTSYSQGSFPSTYYMGLQGYGNPGGMCYGPSLSSGGAGGGGAGAAGQDRGTAPNTSGPTSVRGADGGTGIQVTGFTAPLFCDPGAPNGATVKSTLDPLGGYFAGGGGGSNYTSAQGGAYGGGRGGNGGGGNGSPNGSPTDTYTPTDFNTPPEGYSSTDENGVSYSGGGGGGKGYSFGNVGSGGPGIVVIRYSNT